MVYVLLEFVLIYIFVTLKLYYLLGKISRNKRCNFYITENIFHYVYTYEYLKYIIIYKK